MALHPEAGLKALGRFARWAETGRIRIANLWVMLTEAGKLPNERICPDTDLNFRFSIDEICAQVVAEERAKQHKK